MSQSGSAPVFRAGSSATPRKREPLADPLANERGALADAGGEDERVEARCGGGHRRDGPGDAVDEDREGELGSGLAGERPRCSRSRMSPEPPPRPFRPGFEVERVLELRRRRARGRRGGRRSAPGSTEPERVAIGTPSSGLKPIVVSTDRPSRTAVTEQPPPRWQTTSRSGQAPARRPIARRARGSRSGGCPIPRATARAPRTSMPPAGSSRGTPCRRRRPAARPGSRRSACSIAASAGRVVQRRELLELHDLLAELRASIRTGSRNRGPPCTMRWATASTCEGSTDSRESTRTAVVVGRRRDGASGSASPR